MKTQDFTSEAIDKVKSQFEIGMTVVFGCEINVIRKNEAYQYETQNGKIATMSARYWGTITFPDGTTKDFKKARGGAISRSCGFWSRKERDARNIQKDLHEITNRRIVEN